MTKSLYNKEVAQLPAGTRTTATYDGNGKRRSYGDSAGFRKYAWDGENILLATDGNGVTGRTYTLRPEFYGELVSQRSGTTSFHHYDALGSTRNLTDNTQAITDSRDYKAFGLTNASSGTNVNRFWWVGKYGYYLQPDPGTIWVRANILQPGPGRWQKQDALCHRGGAISRNCYRYVSNSPITRLDPSGLQPEADFMAGFCGRVPPCRGASRAHCRAVLDEAQRQLDALWPVPDVTHLTPERCRQLNNLLWRICHECQRYGDMETRWVEIAILRNKVCRVRPHVQMPPLPPQPPPQPPAWWAPVAKAGYCSMQAQQECAHLQGVILTIQTPRGPIYVDLNRVCLAGSFLACMAM